MSKITSDFLRTAHLRELAIKNHGAQSIRTKLMEVQFLKKAVKLWSEQLALAIKSHKKALRKKDPTQIQNTQADVERITKGKNTAEKAFNETNRRILQQKAQGRN